MFIPTKYITMTGLTSLKQNNYENTSNIPIKKAKFINMAFIKLNK